MIEVQYVGIDSWNRPVFKGDNNAYYGSTDKLYPVGAAESEVLTNLTVEDLEYFGQEFDCEPMGTRPSQPLVIVPSNN